MSTPLKEAVKEGLRFFLSSLIGTTTLCLGIVAASINLQAVTFNPNWMLVGLTALLGVLNGVIGALTRASDKYKHEAGKEKGYTPVEGNAPSLGWLGF